MQGSKSIVTAEENEELVRFRQQWLEEVRSKKKPQASQDGPAASTSTGASAEPASQPPPQSPPAHRTMQRRTSHHDEPTSPVLGPRKTGSVNAAAQLGPSLQRAVEVYRKAVQHEQKSELDDALRLYRTAFRMDSNVDRAYHLVEEELQRKATATSPTQKAQHKKTHSGASGVDGLLQEVQALDLGPSRIPVAHAHGEGFVTGTLATLISAWPPKLSFERDPESEEEGVPIQMLPDEILMIILRLLDHTALERFARVNRKARVITLDASIWR